MKITLGIYYKGDNRLFHSIQNLPSEDELDGFYELLSQAASGDVAYLMLTDEHDVTSIIGKALLEKSKFFVQVETSDE